MKFLRTLKALMLLTPFRIVGYGFLLWLAPFAVSCAAFPLRQAMPPLFESIMAVTVTLCVTVLAVRHFRRLNERFVMEGVNAGITWVVMSIALDIPIFLGPIGMSAGQYFADVALTYLIYPVVTIGMGLCLKSRTSQRPV